jgi:6-phosphofructokinase 1
MKNAFYAQSGGVTAVINASACGVIDKHLELPPLRTAPDAPGLITQGLDSVSITCLCVCP